MFLDCTYWVLNLESKAQCPSSVIWCAQQLLLKGKLNKPSWQFTGYVWTYILLRLMGLTLSCSCNCANPHKL